MQIILNNLKRYKGKYVFSFISIIMSMTLLLNVSSFCEYSTAQIYNENFEPYDIYCDSSNMKMSTSVKNIYKPFSDMKETQKSWWVSSDFIGRYKIITSELSEDANAIFKKEKADFLDVQYLILDDETYNGIYNEIAKKHEVDENYIPAIACLSKDINKSNQMVKIFDKDSLTISFSESENFICNTLNIKLLQSNYPKILENYYILGGINVILSINQWDKYLKEEPNNVRFYFNSNNSSLLYDEMIELQNDKGWDISITNYFASLEKEVSSVKIFEALANIFLLIVGSIVLLNIINTISQTIMMRKREFAIFSSVGMQDKTLLRLTLSENFAIYIVALILSVCITLALSALFKIAFKATFYFFPWLLFLIINIIFALVIFSVSLLFFKKATSMNTIETIKNETV